MIVNLMNRLLEIPGVYLLIQWLMLPGARKLLAAQWRKAFAESTGIVLDVGCGPEPSSPEPNGTLVGVDVNTDYLRQYASTVSTDPGLLLNPKSLPKRLAFKSSADKLPFCDSCADEARAMGLFHHLTDESTVACVSEMIRCVRPSGKIIIFDNVWPRSSWRRPWAWLVRYMDRGRYVRTESGLRSLLCRASGIPWTYKRFTYTYTGLEGMLFVLRKP